MIQMGRWISSFRLLPARHLASFLALNFFFYGLIGLSMIVALEHPQIQRALTQHSRQDLQEHGWSPLVDAYLNRHMLRAACLTFAVNLVLGTIVGITLPSLFIPFIGIVPGMCRAVLWGLTFGLGSARILQVMTTNCPVMLLEGQAYVLGMLGVYLHGKATLMPSTVGATRRWQGYKRGFVQAMRIYPLIALFLAISAVYVAIAVILLLHPR